MSAPSLIAHYRITGKLGEGGMGAVYRAADTKLNREVAIKVLPAAFAADPDRLSRFTREAQVLASLNHPNIATIYGVEDGAIIMELVEGQSPAGPLSPEAALPLIQQLIDALEYAHEKGVVHRDLKPANLKTNLDCRLKVLDFGLAKALSIEPSIVGYPESAPTLTMQGSLEGAILGTPAYMSPEQARGQAVDRRADIWAFGVVVYELLTGRALFHGETVSDTLAAVLRQEIDLAAVSPQFRRLVRVCLERDPRKRLQAIGDARILLEDQPAAVPAPRRGFPLWAASLIALAGIGVAVVHFREAQPPQPVPVRFQIPAPEKTSFGTGMALSPDGRRLAFIGAAANGRTMLWVRPLDSVAAQPLAGAEGAIFTPFWSPDSRSIAFLVEGKLKKIEASGGPAQTLCEVPGTLIGGSWSREGVIVFSGITGGLFRVSQAGGVATRFTTPDESHGEYGHLLPSFLPDGRHFLYLARTRKPEDRAIYLATLDGKQPKRLMSSAQGAAYAPPAPGSENGSENGHLLFLREGTLLALPLDSRRFEPAGEPFPVAEHVGSVLSTGFFSVSANGVLAYRNRGSAGGSELMWFDRQGKSLASLGPPVKNNTGLAFSPDGKRVAVAQRDQTGNLDIWVLDVARGVPTRFTFDGANDSSPVWSPDGTRLVFASDRGPAGTYGLYQKDSSGSANEELLFKSGMSLLPDDWSPDGRYILYSATGQTASELWVLPLSAGTPGDRKPMPYLQGPYSQQYGQFSPDGRWIAYSSNESGSYQVFVQSFPAGAGKFQVSAAGGSQPRWRRDGKEIFYIGADGKLMAVDVKTAPKFEAGAPKELFDPQVSFGAGDYFRYNVTPDGKRFLVNSSVTATRGSADVPITVVLNWPAALKSAAAH